MNSTIATAVIVAVCTLVLQKALVNLINGVQMLFTRPFKKGDKVYITKNGNEIATGHVLRRGLLQTKIKAYNRDVYIISNAALEECCIRNSDYKARTNHIEFLSISLDSNMDKVTHIIMTTILAHTDTLNTIDNTDVLYKYDNGKIRVQYNVRSADVDTSYVVCSEIFSELISKFRDIDDVQIV